MVGVNVSPDRVPVLLALVLVRARTRGRDVDSVAWSRAVPTLRLVPVYVTGLGLTVEEIESDMPMVSGSISSD